MFSIPWPSPSSRTFPKLTASARRVMQRWARRRQGPDSLTTRLRPTRVYILPTGVGLVFGLMSLAMLLGSMNYNNNLSFVMTFLLAGLGLVSMHQCQRNLVDLELRFAGIHPVFAGQPASFRISVTNESRHRRHGIALFAAGTATAALDLKPGESRIFEIPVKTTRRGWVRLPRFGIRTLFPFELFRAWAWLHMDLKGLVYPTIAVECPPPPATETSRGHRQHDARGEEDFAGLRRFHAGDSPRQVAWKAFARSQQLLSKQFAGADTSSQWFDFDAIPLADTETRLSILARWISDIDRSHADYGLRLPDSQFEPAHGEAHRSRCLEALAKFGLDSDDG